jgi:lysophospholipase L1-like esterase
MRRCLLLISLFWLFTNPLLAQNKHAFWDDVQTIKAYDKQYKTPAHPILFVGSSSIRKWDDLQVAFGAYNVINRGVGGTYVEDIIYYADDLIFTYQPRQIVLYVGENDITKADETADTILNRTIRLYRLIRSKLPDVPIVYISMKPSPSRDKFQQKVIATNKLIKAFLATQKNSVFVDIFPLMLIDGHSRPELFVGDMLHMNSEGYAIWEKAVKPYLLKN